MPQEYQRVLVAIDGSKESDLAFKKAVQVAKRNKAALISLHVINDSDSVFSYGYAGIDLNQLIANETKESKEKLDTLLLYAKEQGVDSVQSIIEFGNPKKLIAKTIPEKEKIDLIIVGATGLNAIEGVLVGSVASYVITHAACDVLVVRDEISE